MAVEVKGTSTIETYLMQNTGEPMSAVWEKVIDIIDYPDLGGDPENIDVTTLSDHVRQNIPGIQEIDSLKFNANYTKENFTTLKALNGAQKEYAVWFGSSDGKTPDGHDGKFKFTGEMTSYVTGGGVNEARKINNTISLTSDITVDAE